MHIIIFHNKFNKFNNIYQIINQLYMSTNARFYLLYGIKLAFYLAFFAVICDISPISKCDIEGRYCVTLWALSM